MDFLAQNINAFAKLGEYLRMLTNSKDVSSLLQVEGLNPIDKELFISSHEHLTDYLNHASNYNPWFTPAFVNSALNSIGESLKIENLNKWIESYASEITAQKETKTFGVVMAGNLPLVGFHDYLCVLISGHKILAKISSSDDKLLPLLHSILSSFEPEFLDKARFTKNTLANFDAIIATGSDNTARYFEFYFGKYPNIIRKNRNGVAVLNGSETNEELEALSDDIFMYFGLGCRNVSKIYVPENYNFDVLFKAFEKYAHLLNHAKYFNNYEYNKSIYLINKVPHFDNGFVLIKEDLAYSSPISVLFYETYQNYKDLNSILELNQERIQCLLSNSKDLKKNHFKLGEAQQPNLWDYADGIDTLSFILGLN